MRFSVAFLTLGVLATSLAAAGWAPPVRASPSERHSGTVLKVDSQAGTLVIEELAAEGKARQLKVSVPAQARVILSERIPASQVTDPGRPFRETRIRLSDIHPGDFATVELTADGEKAVAASVTVTLRGGSR